MPLEAQTRLLRVLQEGEFTTVGGRTPMRADVRIVAATHRDLRALVAEGHLPRGPVLPAQRGADPAAAAARAPRGHSGPGPPFRRPGGRDRAAAQGPARKRAMARLKAYDWPGNVRELENLIRRLAALYSEEVITGDIIGQAELRDSRDRQPCDRAARRRTWRRCVQHHLEGYFAATWRRTAGERPLSPYPARDRASADAPDPGRHQRQPDQGGQRARPQPQHVAQEDPRVGHSGRARRK